MSKPKPTNDLETRELREVRLCDLSNLEIREDETPVLTGYAAVFNQEAVIGDWFREVIRPGAFRRAIEEGQDVRALWNHDPNFVLGRTRAGTLELEEDDHGLRVRIQPPNASWANDLVESIRRGDVTQMSFAFMTRKEAHTDAEEGKLPLRELLDVDLYDVSPVTYPAYEATSISARSPEHVVRTWLSTDTTAAAQEGRSDEPQADADEQELEALRLRIDLERVRHRT